MSGNTRNLEVGSWEASPVIYDLCYLGVHNRLVDQTRAQVGRLKKKIAHGEAIHIAISPQLYNEIEATQYGETLEVGEWVGLGGEVVGVDM